MVIKYKMSKRPNDNQVSPRLPSPKNPYLNIGTTKCLNCNKHCSDVKNVKGLPWAQSVTCSECFQSWTICTVCRVRSKSIAIVMFSSTI